MTKEKKTRVARPFPTCPFEDILVIGNAIQEFAAGEKIRRITLFDHIDRSPESGPSRALITNSKKYKLTKGGTQAEHIELTDLGKIATSEIVSKTDKLTAQIELGIFGVNPFNFLYERFKNNKLPSKQVLIDTLKETDIDEQLLSECVDIFIVNLKYFGLLKTLSGSERIITLEHLVDDMDDSVDNNTILNVNTQITTSGHSKDFNNVCFYITPIGSEDSEQRKHADLFFGSIVEPALEGFGVNLVRADKITKPGLINNQIIEYIIKSKLVIADLSYHNPNVFYELAIRHMCRKPIVQIKRAVDSIPFDLQQFRTISIDTTNIYSLVPKLETYKSEIATQIRSALENPDSVDNPLTQNKKIAEEIFGK